MLTSSPVSGILFVEALPCAVAFLLPFSGFPLCEVKRDGSVFCYLYDVIQVFLPVGGIADQELHIIGTHPLHRPVTPSYRESEGAVITVHTTMGA